MKKIIFAMMLVGICSFSYAEVPIVDFSATGDAGNAVDMGSAETTPVDTSSFPHEEAFPAKSNLSVDQRLNKLEHQIENLNRQSSTQKIEDLQERIQQLNGRIDEQSHQIAELTTEVKNFYQDLNQRLEKKDAKVNLASYNISEIQKSTDDGAGASAAKPLVDQKTKESPVAVTQPSKKPSLLDNDAAHLKEQQMYETAIDLLPDKKYAEGAKKLNAYLKAYPKGIYVVDAHYWLGEIYFLQKKMDLAEAEFKIVVAKAAIANKKVKVADASLKIALIHDQAEKHEQAKAELQQIVKKYPNTSAAQLAKQQLEVGT